MGGLASRRPAPQRLGAAAADPDAGPLLAGPGAQCAEDANGLGGAGSGDAAPKLLSVGARTAGGTLFTAEAACTDTVATLKRALAGSCGIPKYQQKLLLGAVILEDARQLSAYDIGEGTELTLVVGPPVPDFARDLGLGGEHPALLRGYCAQHGLEAPAWLQSDDEVWERLLREREEREANKAKLEGWGHYVRLERDGEPSGTIRAAPGERLKLRARGWIHNNKGDTCIHQLVLALDTRVVADISNNVPMRGLHIDKGVSFEAPAELGTYMLWRYGDLQYSMEDAKRNFQNQHGAQVQAGRYPRDFVGWLLVQPPPPP